MCCMDGRTLLRYRIGSVNWITSPIFYHAQNTIWGKSEIISLCAIKTTIDTATAFESVAILDSGTFFSNSRDHDEQIRVYPYPLAVIGFSLGCHLEVHLSPTLNTRNKSEGGSPG